MVIFEIPTGVVADTVGRRASFLLSTVVLLAGTLAYVWIAAAGGGLVPFLAASVVLGLGFTLLLGRRRGVGRRRADRQRLRRRARPHLRARGHGLGCGDAAGDAGRRRAGLDRPRAAVRRAQRAAGARLRHGLARDARHGPRAAAATPAHAARGARPGRARRHPPRLERAPGALALLPRLRAVRVPRVGLLRLATLPAGADRSGRRDLGGGGGGGRALARDDRRQLAGGAAGAPLRAAHHAADPGHRPARRSHGRHRTRRRVRAGGRAADARGPRDRGAGARAAGVPPRPRAQRAARHGGLAGLDGGERRLGAGAGRPWPAGARAVDLLGLCRGWRDQLRGAPRALGAAAHELDGGRHHRRRGDAGRVRGPGAARRRRRGRGGGGSEPARREAA